MMRNFCRNFSEVMLYFWVFVNIHRNLMIIEYKENPDYNNSI